MKRVFVLVSRMNQFSAILFDSRNIKHLADDAQEIPPVHQHEGESVGLFTGLKNVWKTATHFLLPVSNRSAGNSIISCGKLKRHPSSQVAWMSMISKWCYNVSGFAGCFSFIVEKPPLSCTPIDLLCSFGTS